MRVGQEGGQLPIQTISRKTHLVTLRKLERGEDKSGGGCEGHEVERGEDKSGGGCERCEVSGAKTGLVKGVRAMK